MEVSKDTIAAIATPPGNGGVGIIRISGKLAPEIAFQLLNKQATPRYAHYTVFKDEKGDVLDQGLLIYFPAPHSFTGEHIVELQSHGGAMLMDMILRRILLFGVRLARPGEFSERAFLNEKIDLAQAEAIADLITSSTEKSVRSAQKSLQGVFSEQINVLVQELTELRIYVEAAIDFVEEEIDFLNEGAIAEKLIILLERLNEILRTAQQGQLLRDGMTIVLAGKPNAGKSSLLNALTGQESAIVTDIAGTTRDLLKESIQLDGMPLHIIDTAGLHETDNSVEQEGIRRAYQAINSADIILLLVDAQDGQADRSLLQSLPKHIPTLTVFNKIDLTGQPAQIIKKGQSTELYLSVKTMEGLDLLKQHLKSCMDYHEDYDNVFIARRRHLEAINSANQHVQLALEQLQQFQAGELVAEELKTAQNYLGEITGKLSSDDLLGKIFSSFCIGK